MQNVVGTGVVFKARSAVRLSKEVFDEDTLRLRQRLIKRKDELQAYLDGSTRRNMASTLSVASSEDAASARRKVSAPQVEFVDSPKILKNAVDDYSFSHTQSLALGDHGSW